MDISASVFFPSSSQCCAMDSFTVKQSHFSVEVHMQESKLVGYGVDTLILNVRYSDSKGQPVKQELDEKLVQELDYLQGEARHVETAVAMDWAFQEVLLFVEPHGAGKQWRWLLTSRLLNIAVSHGKFNVLTCATQKKMYFH